jgi:hypothetical protein
MESLRFFLRHSDKNNRIPHGTLATEFIGQIVFLLFVLELVNRYPLSLRQRLQAARNFSDI